MAGNPQTGAEKDPLAYHALDTPGLVTDTRAYDMPPLIDTHCHFDDPRFDPDREQVCERARAAGVERLVVPGIIHDWWPRLRQLCLDYPGLHPAYGLHPMFMERHLPQHMESLADWLAREPAVAIGECGLDFFIPNADRAEQLMLFEQHLELARSTGLPLIIHARRSVEEVIHRLRHYPGVSGVLHSFSGSLQQAGQLMDMGFMLGFGGAVTYPRASRLRRLVAELPLEHIVLETDAPDQPDAAIPRQRNEPARLAAILQIIARLRNTTPGELAAATRANSRRLFAI